MKHRRLRIGIVAPPWLTVPPRAYGGTELVIDALCTGLADAGHDVWLFTVGDSTAPVRRLHLFDHVDLDRMGSSVVELRHVAAAYDAFANPSSKIDVVHDNTLIGLFISALHPGIPVLATNHGPFDDDLTDLFRRVARRVPIITISRDQAASAPSDIPIAATIRHGLDLSKYPVGRGEGGYALFLGRMAEDKGVDTAIRVARAAGLKLRIAAKMREPAERRFFEREIERELGDDVEFVGEADFGHKTALLADARVLINPIRWPEPFGLVMAEALACGTPVAALPHGAAPEIVDHGVTGYIAHEEDDLIIGVRRSIELDRAACRRAALERFSSTRMANEHIALYRRVITDHAHRRSNPQLRSA